VLNGKVNPGDSVAIVGAGPIGLASLLTAQFYAPADVIMIDVDANRLEVAKQFGATRTVDSGKSNAIEAVMKLTADKDVDVAIEAVGSSATFDICQGIVAAGGTIANIGVHGRTVELHLEKLWDRNISLTTRLVDTVSTPLLLKTVMSGRLQPNRLITHRFTLAQITQAYDTFGNAARERALKVIINND
jgi:alcohol dehydrogenase